MTMHVPERLLWTLGPALGIPALIGVAVVAALCVMLWLAHRRG